MDEPTATNPAADPAMEVSNLEHVSPVVVSERVSAAMASLKAEVEALSDTAARHEQREAEMNARDSALRVREAAVCAGEGRIAERQRELDSALEKLAADAGGMRDREAALVERERAVMEREQAAPAAPWADERSAIRRARLKKQRTLLSERAMQLMRAKEVLASRLSDTARTRTSLPLAGQAIPAAPPKAAEPAPSGRSSAASFGVGMLMSSLAFVAILGVSWWAAGLIDQPRFAAQTTIGMANQAASMDADAAESWRSFHEELSMDPQLLERASARLRQRGYEELRTPSDLRSYLEEFLVIESGAPGRMNLSITGEGRLRTQRILESYVAVLIGMSNDSRERRADRATTMVLSDATSATEPIADTRLPYFAGIAGVLTVLCGAAGLAGVSAASRAAAAKTNSAVAVDGGEDVWSVR